MLRVGSVPYLVGRPLDRGLGDEAGIELTHDVPARLVESLRSGAIDVALVSSIELFRRPGYGYIDGPAVCGFGHVSSVQVFLRRPVDEVRTVALDPASRTAATLSRVVWPSAPMPEFRERPGDPREADTDAWLRIGDRALTETYEPDAHPTLNPSAEWARRTGLPFVFAPWIVRAGVDVEPYAAAFARAAERGASQRRELALAEAAAQGWPPDAIVRYLEDECAYSVGDALGPALREFGARAAALDLADPACSPHPVPIAT